MTETNTPDPNATTTSDAEDNTDAQAQGQVQGQNSDVDTFEDPDDIPMLSELDTLKTQATMLGVAFSPNIGLETLRKRVEAKLNETAPEETAEQTAAKVAEAKADLPSDGILTPKTVTKEKALALTDEQVREHPEKMRRRLITIRQRHEHLRLVRVQIYNNNPAKNDLYGEIMTAANKYVGNVRKYIPFGEATENGYHVPAILLGVLRAKKYQKVKNAKNPDGTTRVVNQLVPEFTIVELPALTVEEIKELATRQEAAKRVGLI